MMVRTLGIVALLALAATAARADWEGDVEIKSAAVERHTREPPKGKLRFKGTKMRMEIRAGPMGEMVNIVDFKEHTVFIIMPQQQTYMEMSPDAPGMGMGPRGLPTCKQTTFTACMKESGFKKTGSETVNGQASTVWEGDRPSPQAARYEKLWHPDAAGDEIAFVRIENSGPDGRSTQFNVLNWKKAKQDAGLFKVPEGYTKAEGFPGMMGMPPGGPGGRGMRPGMPPGMPGGRPPMGPTEDAKPPEGEKPQD